MRRRLSLTLPIVCLTVLGVTITPLPAAADPAPDPALQIVDAWDVTGAHTFPGSTILPAQRPSIAEAPNGDLLVTFNTTGDGHPGGQLRVIRSTDEGRTWGPSEVLAEPRLYGPSGSIAAQRGIATMADGTMLAPYNDMINHSNYNSRESTLFVARSTDNGHTWTGTDTPVTLPRPIREAHVAGSPILTLADGTVLLGIWGALELTEDWETDPMPWASGVLRSFDGGATWSDYRTVAFDPNNPVQYPPFHSARYPSGANEFAMHELPDGRILAVIRYATKIGANPGQSYLSYSSDSGATWSDPVPMSAGMNGVGAEALSLFESTCTDMLSGDASKLLMGHRVLNAAGTRIGQAAVRVSFDDGVTWGHSVTLQDASGSTSLGAATGEPTFHRLDDGRILVLFQVFDGGPSRIVANLLEDSGTAAECQAEADAAAAVDDVLLSFERADRDAWPWPLATSAGRYTSQTPLAEVVADASAGTSCDPEQPRLRLRGESESLNLGLTVGQAGLRSGDVLVLDDAAAVAGTPRIGHNALDVAPETRRLYAWNDACDYGLELDAQARGLGIDLGEFSAPLDSIELVDSDGESRLDNGTGALHGEAGLLNQDLDPATGALDFSFSGSIAVDYRYRSVGLRFPEAVQVQRLRITDRDATSRLVAGNYSLWASTDGVTYQEITGWSLSSEVVSGRLVHSFDGFDVTAVAVKINTNYSGTAYTFVLNSFADLDAFGVCSGTACAPPPYEVFVSDDNDHFQQVSGWNFESSLEAGRLVHRLQGLDITSRYVKVTQPYTDTVASFRLGSLREDVRLGFAAPADTATTAPALGVLSSDNGWDTGLDDGDYNVSMNLWWGENASEYRLYENGVLVARGSLETRSPQAQRFVVPIAGRPDGSYTYVAALVNSQGTRLTEPLTVEVDDAGPAIPVLSADNWDGDGDYTVTANLWWGTNATSYRLFENDTLVDEGPLAAGTPAAQEAVFVASDRAPGRYVYRVEFVNAAGVSTSTDEVVTVER